MFHVENARFRYEPYPIGLIRPAFDENVYQQLVTTFPPAELFMDLPKVGQKLLLSEKFHPRQYHDYVASSPPWRELHRAVKSTEFIASVLEMLRGHGIDLGYKHYPPTAKRALQKTWLDLRRGRWPRYDARLSARFDYSMIPANGGYIAPHTDSPGKVVTLVVSMAKEGDWDPSFGGATDVNRLLDPRRSFNHLNDKCRFDEVEVLESFPFEPNQIVLFVKTFNSWHSVRPTTGGTSTAMRRTLTINIEEDD